MRQKIVDWKLKQNVLEFKFTNIWSLQTSLTSYSRYKYIALAINNCI